jgi:cyanophycin synthetase
MASVAAVWALGLDWDTIRKGLASFSTDENNAAGRFNVFQFRGATVIADYGHNPDAMLALVNAVNTMPATRRSVVISGAGDRRDQDIRQITEILGDAFEEVVMFEDQCQRGRQDGEVMALLRQGLAQARKATQRSEISGEFLAIDTAMDKLQAGELCLILVDQVDEAMAYIATKIAQDA